uniref:hypothetical protein n=1 Tax=uncultured Ilyobacter sp. TaxID=544433 RepID=UPI0029F4D890
MATALNYDEHLRRILRIHFDPDGGAPYWLKRQRELGFDVVSEIQSLADLPRLGAFDENALRDQPLRDFIPISRRAALAGAIVTETGGTTGAPKRTVFAREEFEEAFITPFVRAAQHAGFPLGATWLWVGPSGPHVIGQAAAWCATALGSPQPFSVDFDPRWFRKLPADSLARERYMEHLLEQALHVITREPVEVLFTTPIVLEQLAERMNTAARERVRGVHYGGMRVEPALLHKAQTEWFPRAVHLAGYGNSLFGLCMEFGGAPDRQLRYYPYGARHVVRIGDNGRVWMSRLDPTVLIANLAERDRATTTADVAAPVPGYGPPIEDPRPFAQPTRGG